MPPLHATVHSGDMAEEECGVARFQALLGGPWAMLIVRELLDGPRRFGQIATALPGMSAHTLASRLRRFEAHGLVTRTVYETIPPKVVYELTVTGSSLAPLLEAMNQWAISLPESRPGAVSADEPRR